MSADSDPESPAPQPATAAPEKPEASAASIGPLWRAAARAAVFMRPDWHGVQASPLRLALLAVLGLGLSIAIDRAYIVGPASFYAAALQAGWWSLVVLAWASWMLVPRPADATTGAPDAAALFAVQWAQSLLMFAAMSALVVPLVRSGLWEAWQAHNGAGFQALVWLPALWFVGATLVLLWRASSASAPTRGAVVGLVALTLLAATVWQPARLWYADRDTAEADAPARLSLDELRGQEGLLARQLDAIERGRPGVVNVFAITFAPYAEEDVFKRESALVASVMRGRFGAQGRTLELVTHRQTLGELPVATAANLKQAITAMAARMDREADVLFIHLTSHGAANGALSASLDLLAVEPVRPEQIKAWLDEAGVRWRVVSVSACYSGSWIKPLAGDTTLVMTAADSEHTSYGCGRKAELTYFGRAMFDEELRRTHSFEEAHANARRVIDEREKAAGKSDGYSNPQIEVGAGIKPVLERLAQEQAAR